MKKNIYMGLISGLALAALSTNAMAHDRNSCGQEKRTAGTIGGFIGAGAGAAAGRALAAASVRPEGVILGTVVGAIIGAKVGKETVECNDNFARHGNMQNQYNNQPNGNYYNNNSYNNGWYQPSPYGYYGQQTQYAQPAPVAIEQWSNGTQYVPAPQYYAPAPVQYAPRQQTGCGGYWVCQ